MMKNLIFILAFAILSIVSLYAQDSLPPVTFDYDPFLADTEKIVNLYDNGIGLSYSTMSGYGLTYLRRFLDNFSVLFSGFITYEEYMRWTDLRKTSIERDDKNIYFDFGAELQADIIKSNKTKIYAMVGASFTTENQKDRYNNDLKDIFSVGAGFGLQWYMARNFAGYFHFGYKFQNTDSETGNSPSIERKTTIGIGFGVLLLF